MFPMIKFLSFKTIFGWITISELNQKIISVKFGKKNSIDRTKILIKTKNQILRYCSGKLKIFDINIKIDGTNLQKKIWSELKKIPYGKTKTYGQIAEKLNTSSRYVGNVCAQNNHLLLVPCHRVIRSD